ncbi:MAG: dihydrolipoyl dehydrogenase [Cryobacterium sp.]|nr:dihydrolipoyl dehydrogenase [Oligoflexia bacterium]
MSETNYDLIIIGGGPAGYTSAIRATQLGFKTACVEKRKTLGGTCLNVGCIPSKALLESSEHFYQAKTKFAKHGIVMSDIQLDLDAMQKRKEGIVRQLTNGIAGLFKKHGVDSVSGHGKIVGKEGPNYVVEVTGEAGVSRISAPRILLATGSETAELPFLKFDGKTVVSSTEALELTKVPEKLIVIGGGVIGLEMGSVWSRLGSKITVIEFQDRILPGTDIQAGKELAKALVKQGFDFKLSHKCLGAKPQGEKMIVEAEDMANGGTKVSFEGDIVLVSTGRRPYTANVGLETVGITLDKQGRVPINEHFETSASGIYAVGDIVDGPMLAHKAEEEGVAAVELMAGQPGHVNYEAIPNVVYTWPELATVGYTEEEVKASGVAYSVGVFPFIANARAKTMDEVEGFVKIIADQKTDKILGAHIVGPRASDLIPEIVSVIEFGGSSEDIARTCHAHPTLSESVKEAALMVDKRSRNI